jgi:pectate lyase
MSPSGAMRVFGAALVFLLAGIPAAFAGAVGYGAAATGGRGGETRTARNAGGLEALAGESDEPLIIRIEGNFPIGNIAVRSNKTIEGAGRNPGFTGALSIGRGVSNVIVRNLHITNPSKKKKAEGLDGITIRGGRRVWIDSCTFTDCADGAIDISHGADLVTVSWCKFQYSSPKLPHRLVMLAYGPPKKRVKSKLRLTLHHNWFAENCGSRMPAATKARVHLFNNFFDCPGNSYATNARKDAEILAENNVYRRISNPFYKEKNGKLKSSGNIFDHCSGKLDRGTDTVFTPPYPFSPDPAAHVPDLVRARAGCRL